jgi:hypothetical protein
MEKIIYKPTNAGTQTVKGNVSKGNATPTVVKSTGKGK